ncbi:MAG TPA: DUF1566 domain-containing protein [Candidatus Binatia bacterium]|nr:DUF1566 domain-containing protein [Candidatus Binatia bacterium]
MKHAATFIGLAGGLVLTWAGPGHAALTAAQKCQAAKLIAAGKDAACQASALAKAALGGVNTVGKCDAKLSAAFTKLEAKGGCASTNDAPTFAARVALSSVVIEGLAFYPGAPGGPTNGPHFTDNGDGTVTDDGTGLQWEQKTFDPTSVHYGFAVYAWSSSGCVNGGGVPMPGDDGTLPDGTAFTTFLATLDDSSAPGGCFAGHCDWRMPTATELGTILDPHAPTCGQPPQGACIDPIFGPAAQAYWSSDTEPGVPTLAFLTFPFVDRSGLPVDAQPTDKCASEATGYPFIDFSARAVRSVSGPNCGSPEQPCCAGATCSDPSVACSAAGTCIVCGGLGQPCCAANACTAGTCTGGVCTCVPQGGACTVDADCCSPGFCGSGVCTIIQ